MELETRKRWPVEERQRQFVEIALDLFGRRPFDEISMDNIANEANVTKGLLYRYFKSKRELYLSALQKSAEEIFELTEPASEQPLADQLLDSIDAYLAAIEQQPERYVMFVKSGVGFDQEVWDVIDEYHRLYVDRIITAAAPRSTESEALKLAVLGWIGFVEFTATNWLQKANVSRSQVRDLLAANLVATLVAATQIDPKIELAEFDL